VADWHGSYGGTAAVQYARIEYDGDRIAGYGVEGPLTVTAGLLLGPPLSTTVNAESNPVNLLLSSGEGPGAAGLSTPGEFVIYSAGSFSTPDHPRPSVVQAWRLAFEGSELVGTLVGNAKIVPNFVMVASGAPGYIEVDLGPSPFTLPYGTELRARRTPEGLELVVLAPPVGTQVGAANRVAYAAELYTRLTRQS
jgi:hypothetical protein